MPMTGFVCQDTYLSKLAKLSDQEVGRLMRALMMYHASGEEPELTGRESVAFDFIRDDIDRAEAAYQQKREQLQANASKSKQKHANAGECEQNTADDPQYKEKEKDKYKRDIYTHDNNHLLTTTRAREWFDPENPGAGDDGAWRTSEKALLATAQRIASWGVKRLRQGRTVTEAGEVGGDIHEALCEAMRSGVTPAECVSLEGGTTFVWEWELLLKTETVSRGRGRPEWREQVDELRDELPRLRERNTA